MKYQAMSETVLKAVGGKENITSVTHCATRLRIDARDTSIIDLQLAKSADQALGAVVSGGQLQVIIGPNVTEAYNDFLDFAGIEVGGGTVADDAQTAKDLAEGIKSGNTAMGLIEKFGNVSAQVFMPIVPALIVGGLILSIKNLLVNYCGLSTDSGTAQVLLAIFSASFSFLPVYLGYQLAAEDSQQDQLAAVMKMQPIMGALLGAIMISSSISGAEGLDFLGIPIPTNDYSSTVVPIVLGVVFMYFVDRVLQKIIPDVTKLFLKPLLTMVVVVPVELIVLGPAGSMMGYALSDAVTWLMDNVAFIATPILAALNPYFVMLGLDKAYIAIEVTSLAQLGWAPIIFGFISNLCIGGTSLALATAIKGNKEKRGMVTTVAVTALCGVTEPAFYGCLIERPRLLVGTAIGALRWTPCRHLCSEGVCCWSMPRPSFGTHLYRSRWVHGQLRAGMRCRHHRHRRLLHRCTRDHQEEPQLY